MFCDGCGGEEEEAVMLDKVLFWIGGLVAVFYFVMILYFSRNVPKWSDDLGQWMMWLMMMGISCLCVLGGVALMGSCLDSMGGW
ncbi:MAG: hypothetical protein BWY29_01041 [Microgenomates group bacterium ADurb.Bin238]|nr:MAG: hypothetical protein BWY29_01041 [Microgenomates group bacterium ADurb.Bin238]